MCRLFDMTGLERVALAHEVKCSPATVRRFEKDPESVSGGWKLALTAAAKKLKIDVSSVGAVAS